MSIIGSNIIAGASGQGDGGGGTPSPSGQIDRSLRFNSADTAYLNRTPSSAGNRQTWTWSGWVKRSELENKTRFFGNHTSSGINGLHFEFNNNDRIRLVDTGATTSTKNWELTTESVYRDPSAWYHIIVTHDTTESTAADRVKIYVNSDQVTDFNLSNYPTLNHNSNLNTAQEHALGRSGAYNTQLFNGYFADIHFIDGQALAPSDFGEYDDNNVWQPKAYSGTYGTNGFHLDFSDNTSTTTISEDSSGNNNDWTANNISVSSGSGNDSLIDTPTNYTASGNNGGNYATLNPLATSSQLSLSNGNLQVSAGGTDIGSALATIAIGGSGKYYFECNMASDVNGACGIAPADLSFDVSTTTRYGNEEEGHALRMDSSKYQANSGNINVSYDFTVQSGNIIGCLINLDDDEITWSKNGTLGTAKSITSNTTWLPFSGCFNGAGSTAHTVNFGQQPFQYLPTGYSSLCTQNLPDPTIADGSTAMDVNIYTGNGSTQTISGLGFSPDWVWIKRRDATRDHYVYDVIRGATKSLSPNTSSTEKTNVTTNLTGFSSDGWTMGGHADTNISSGTYVGWSWDAGSSTVTNTNGSITSSVRANPSVGFSIVSYTGNGSSGSTIGHGLNAAPQMIIIKARNVSRRWMVGHQGIASDPWTDYLQLHSTSAAVDDISAWNDTAPTSSVFTVGNANGLNGNTETHIAYCFAPVEGYSAFGSYDGNSSTDGPFVYTGFRPRWIMVKKCNGGTGNWLIYDTSRDEFNVAETRIRVVSSAEDTQTFADFLSNGFKIRNSVSELNGTQRFIYAAFGDPFKTARAR